MSPTQQAQFLQALNTNLKPQDYAILEDIGVPPERIQTALIDLTHASPLSLSTALQTQIGQAWQTLYLGNMNGKVAGVVQVSGSTTQTGKMTEFNAAEVDLLCVIIGFVLQENGDGTHENG